MTTFKELLQKDHAGFFNKDEFAKEHIIDGELCICILGEDKSTDNKTDGVYNMRRRLFIAYEVLGYRPEPEQKMEIDNNYFYVIDCIGNDLLEVVLEAHET